MLNASKIQILPFQDKTNVNYVNSKTSVLIHSNLFYANSLEENQIN